MLMTASAANIELLSLLSNSADPYLSRPVDVTAAGKPVAIIEQRSTSLLFPLTAVGAVNACMGATGKARRTTVVRIPESATERSTSDRNGNESIRFSNFANASTASSNVGLFGILGNCTPMGSK